MSTGFAEPKTDGRDAGFVSAGAGLETFSSICLSLAVVSTGLAEPNIEDRGAGASCFVSEVSSGFERG